MTPSDRRWSHSPPVHGPKDYEGLRSVEGPCVLLGIACGVAQKLAKYVNPDALNVFVHWKNYKLGGRLSVARVLPKDMASLNHCRLGEERTLTANARSARFRKP